MTVLARWLAEERGDAAARTAANEAARVRESFSRRARGAGRPGAGP